MGTVQRWQGGALVDTGELNAHVFALRSSGKVIMDAVEDATELAAQRVQESARQVFAGTRYWKPYGERGITFDVVREGGGVVAEIGAKRGQRGTQTSMAHWLEYGTSRQGPIKPHLGPALQSNQEPYEKALESAAMLTALRAIP